MLNFLRYVEYVDKIKAVEIMGNFQVMSNNLNIF
jgi:hypothetical protein